MTIQSQVLAGGVVNNCDEAGLRTALTGGGLVTFNCDATIALTNTLNISVTTTIDATGHEVVLSGNDSVRVFTVSNSITLTLINLTVADGVVAGTNGAA